MPRITALPLIRYGLPDVAGYNPLIVRRFHESIERSNGEAFRDRHFAWATRAQTPFLRDLAVAYYVTRRSGAPAGCAVVWSDREVAWAGDPAGFSRLAETVALR